MNKVKYLPRFLILHTLTRTHMCENVLCMYVNVLGWVQGCSNYQHYDTLVHMVTPCTAMYQCVCNIISHHLMGISILMCYENQRVRFSFLFGLIWDFINKIWHIQPKTSISSLWHCIYLNQAQATLTLLYCVGVVLFKLKMGLVILCMKGGGGWWYRLVVRYVVIIMSIST